MVASTSRATYKGCGYGATVHRPPSKDRYAVPNWNRLGFRAATLGAISGTTILLAGCEFTRISAVRDPLAPSQQYRRVLVVAPFQDLRMRRVTENAFVAYLKRRGTEGVRSVEVLLPTRTYGEAELAEAISGTGADAVLVVTSADISSVPFYLPAYTSGQVNAFGGFTSTTVGGFPVSLPVLRCNLRLIDIASGRTAWVATSESEGGSFDDFVSLIRSIASKAARQLEKDGLVGASSRTGATPPP